MYELLTRLDFDLFFVLYNINTFIGTIIHPKRMFFILAQQKRETEKQMKDNINEATNTFLWTIQFCLQ